MTDKNTQLQEHKGFVRCSTFYFAIGIALVAGLYAGSLLPGVLRADTGMAQQQGANVVASNAPAEQQPAVSPDVSKQILDLEQAVLKKPDDLAAWITLGNLYFDIHNHKGAIIAYEKALAIKPNNADVLTDLGIMYRDEKMYDQAVKSFDKAIKVNAKHQNALFNKGVVLFFDMNRKEEGRAAWRELLAVNPGAKSPDGKSVRELIERR